MNTLQHSVPVVDIYLDSENPRHEPIENLQEIIAYLVSDEKVVNLAKDISQIGLNPLDSIAVMKTDKGHYIALEGNRRLCALKLLNDPKLAPPNKYTIFSNIQTKAKIIPDEINVIEFDRRESAEPWIDRRHLGQQDGIGVKDWTPDQQARQSNNKSSKTKSSKNNNSLAQALLDYAQKQKLISSYPKRVLTTASRYLGNPEVRKGLGITSSRSNPNVEINVTHEEFDVGLKQFCNDLLDGQKVHSRSKKDEWIEYISELTEAGIAPTQRVANRLLSDRNKHLVKSSSGTEQKNHTKPTSSNNSTKSTNHPDKRKYILTAEFKINTKNPILRRIAGELKDILVEDNPLAVALVTRAFLESIYGLFIEIRQGKYPTAQTHVVIQQVYKELCTEAELTKSQKNALTMLNKLAYNKHSILSPQSLGGFAHAGAYPDHKLLKREFDNIAPIIEYILAKV